MIAAPVRVDPVKVIFEMSGWRVSASPVVLQEKVAESAGLKVAHKKNPRMRYIAMSRVVFDPEGARAWLAVELNGTRGSIVRLDKKEGQWSKTSRCGGWYIPE